MACRVAARLEDISQPLVRFTQLSIKQVTRCFGGPQLPTTPATHNRRCQMLLPTTAVAHIYCCSHGCCCLWLQLPTTAAAHSCAIAQGYCALPRCWGALVVGQLSMMLRSVLGVVQEGMPRPWST